MESNANQTKRQQRTVHPFAGVPMEEGLTTEHYRELLCHALPCLLDGRGVADECGGHLKSLWWNIANRRLHVIRDPLNKVRRVLVHDAHHLLIDSTTCDRGRVRHTSSNVTRSGYSFLILEMRRVPISSGTASQ